MTMLTDTKIECYYDTHEGRKAKYSFPFHTKEEYLQWRDEWRVAYKELSAEITQLRLDRKQAALELKNIDEDDHWSSAHAKIQNAKQRKRDIARGMMEMRMTGKEHSIKLKKHMLKKAA